MNDKLYSPTPTPQKKAFGEAATVKKLIVDKVMFRVKGKANRNPIVDKIRVKADGR